MSAKPNQTIYSLKTCFIRGLLGNYHAALRRFIQEFQIFDLNYVGIKRKLANRLQILFSLTAQLD